MTPKIFCELKDNKFPLTSREKVKFKGSKYHHEFIMGWKRNYFANLESKRISRNSALPSCSILPQWSEEWKSTLEFRKLYAFSRKSGTKISLEYFAYECCKDSKLLTWATSGNVTPTAVTGRHEDPTLRGWTYSQLLHRPALEISPLIKASFNFLPRYCSSLHRMDMKWLQIHNQISVKETL